VITLVLATRLSALEVLHNICNMGTHDLPDMYAHVATIKCIYDALQPHAHINFALNMHFNYQ